MNDPKQKKTAEIERLTKSLVSKLPFTAPEAIAEKVRYYIDGAMTIGEGLGAASHACASKEVKTPLDDDALETIEINAFHECQSADDEEQIAYARRAIYQAGVDAGRAEVTREDNETIQLNARRARGEGV